MRSGSDEAIQSLSKISGLRRFRLRSPSVRVGYDDKPAFISVADLSNYPLAIKKVLSQKKFNWAYEREWRLLGTPGVSRISDRRAVKRIYLGTRISDDHKQKLVQALSGTEIQIFEMRVKDYGYTHHRVRHGQYTK